MEVRNERLRNGLRKLYYAQIIAIVSILCMILAFIPILGLLILTAVVIAVLVGLVLTIMGLVKLGDVHSNYVAALILSIVGGIMGLFDRWVVFDLLSTILSLVVIWLLIKTTNVFLEEIGRSDVAQKGSSALTCNIIASVIAVLCTLMGMFGLTMLLAIAALVVSLVGLVFYVSYLKQASEAF